MFLTASFSTQNLGNHPPATEWTGGFWCVQTALEMNHRNAHQRDRLSQNGCTTLLKLPTHSTTARAASAAEIYCLTVLEDRCPKSRFWQGGCFWEPWGKCPFRPPSCLAGDHLLPHICTWSSPYIYVCVEISIFFFSEGHQSYQVRAHTLD